MITARQQRQRQNRRIGWALSLVAVAMFGFGFALVPLYQVLCDVIGLQTVTLLTEEDRMVVSQQTVNYHRSLVVKFDASVQPNLPWDFQPLQGRIEVFPGETYEVAFLAHNRSNSKVVGQAIANIVPWQATPYFNKLECFCFSRQSLLAGETVSMPLRFVVSTDLPVGINSLTLSYTFMKLVSAVEEDENENHPLSLTNPIMLQRRKIDVSQGS